MGEVAEIVRMTMYLLGWCGLVVISFFLGRKRGREEKVTCEENDEQIPWTKVDSAAYDGSDFNRDEIIMSDNFIPPYNLPLIPHMPAPRKLNLRDFLEFGEDGFPKLRANDKRSLFKLKFSKEFESASPDPFFKGYAICQYDPNFYCLVDKNSNELYFRYDNFNLSHMIIKGGWSVNDFSKLIDRVNERTSV